MGKQEQQQVLKKQHFRQTIRRTEFDRVIPWRERVSWNGALRRDTILPKWNNKKQRSARVHVAQ